MFLHARQNFKKKRNGKISFLAQILPFLTTLPHISGFIIYNLIFTSLLFKFLLSFKFFVLKLLFNFFHFHFAVPVHVLYFLYFSSLYHLRYVLVEVIFKSKPRSHPKIQTVLYGAPNGSKILFWKGRYFFRDRDTSCGKGDTSSEIEILLAESEILF